MIALLVLLIGSARALDTSLRSCDAPACPVIIPAGATLSAGGCVLPGAGCQGDTLLSLVDANQAILVSNDDGYDAACGMCSFIQFANTDMANDVKATLVQTCFNFTGGQQSACTATTKYAFSDTTQHGGPLGGTVQITVSSPSAPAISSVALVVFILFAVVGLVMPFAFYVASQRPQTVEHAAHKSKPYPRSRLSRSLDVSSSVHEKHPPSE
jgi:hypothetical protein